MKRILTALLSFCALTMYAQQKITSYTYTNDSLKSAVQIYEYYRDCIDLYNGKTVTLQDVVVSVSYSSVSTFDHLYLAYKEYLFRQGRDLSEPTFYRREGVTATFRATTQEECRDITWMDEPFPFYVPCDFVVSVKDNQGYKEVRFKRVVKADYLIEELQQKE